MLLCVTDPEVIFCLFCFNVVSSVRERNLMEITALIGGNCGFTFQKREINDDELN